MDEGSLDQMLSLVPDAAVVVDGAGVIVAVNRHVVAVFGYEPDELIGESLEILVPERYRAGHRGQRASFLSDPHVRPMGAGLELFGRRRDGSEVPVDISLAPVTVGGRGLAVAAVRDITERKRIEEELRALLATQAEMAAELELARVDRERLLVADERERIARDLHDHAVQTLFAIGLSLQGIVPLIDNARAQERLQEAVDSLDATIRQIRTAIFTLSAPRTPSGGLRAEVVQLAAEAARGLGFDPTVTFDGPVDLGVSPAVAAHVTAVVREALSNIARHAHATAAAVELRVSPDRCEVRVRDDGTGAAATGSGHGLANLRSRAVELGGDLDIDSRPGRGTSLCWHVPLG